MRTVITGFDERHSYFSLSFLPAFAFFALETVKVESTEPPDETGVGLLIRGAYLQIPARHPRRSSGSVS